MGRKLFALAVAAFFIYITSSLLLPVIMGAVVAVLFMPLLEIAESKGVPTILASGLLTILITLLVLVPAGVLVFLGAKMGFQQLQHVIHPVVHSGAQVGQAITGTAGGDWIDTLMATPKMQQILDWISRYFPGSTASIEESAHDLVQNVMLGLANWLGHVVTALPGMLLALAVTTVSLFFFLVDGRGLVLFFRRNTIFTPPQTEELVHAMAGMCRSVILASVASGIAQAVLMFGAGVALGVPDIALVTGLVFVGSFIPVVGSGPVTLGVMLQQFFMAGTSHGVAMLVMVGVIAGADNLVRPLFLRGSANLHPLLAFVAAFGGLQTFGFIGVFLGPIIAGLLLSTIHILTTERESARASVV